MSTLNRALLLFASCQRSWQLQQQKQHLSRSRLLF